MPLGQALLLSPYAAFMNSLEAYLPPSPKESSYLDTLIGIFSYYPASPSESLEKPTQVESSSEPPKPTHPSFEHPDATPEFSIIPFPPRKPLPSPYLSPILVQAQPTLPHLDLSLELRKLSAFNLRNHALLSLSRSRTATHSKRHNSRSYPPSPPLSSSSFSSTYDAAYSDSDSASASAYDAWFDNIPRHLGLRLPHAQAPRLVLAIFSVFVLALMGQLVLVWMMTREWGVFAS